MDPIAHTLVGATMAESGLRHRTPLATATLLIGANLPDVDAVAGAFWRDASLFWRRGHTHGAASMVVLPLLLVGSVWLYDRFFRRRRDPEARPVRVTALLPLAYLSVWSHPALDWLNTYGVRLLMPFDGTWFYGDSIFIVDPWMWLLMAAAAVLARSNVKTSRVAWLILALATSALVLGAPMTPWPAKIVWTTGLGAIVFARTRATDAELVQLVARSCLALLLFYVSVSLFGTRVAKEETAVWFSDNVSKPDAVMAGPMPANPFSRDIIITTPHRYHFYTYHYFGRDRFVESHEPVARNSGHPAVRAAWQAPELAGLKNWIRFPAYEVSAEPPGAGQTTVRISDVRYVRRGAGLGSATVVLDGRLNVVRVER